MKVFPIGLDNKDQVVSLRISNIIGLRALLSLIFVVIFVFVLEVSARSQLVQERIPFQAFGTNHIQFEMQWANWEKFIHENGVPDCIIMGNSMSLRDLVPEIIQAEYYNRTGENLVCYNFSVTGLRIVTIEKIANYIINKYQPKLFIFGTSFLDYNMAREQGEDSRFLENEWFQYRMGNFSVKGWLVDRSAAYRAVLYLGYFANDKFNFDLSDGVGKEIIKWSNQLTEHGAGITKHTDLTISQPLSLGETKKFFESMGDFSVSKSNMAALANLAEFQKTEKTQVILIILPFHDSLIQMNPDADLSMDAKYLLEGFISDVRAEIISIGGESGALVWEYADVSRLPEDGWRDKYHLNEIGSHMFSIWFAQKLADAISSGEIYIGSGQ